MEYKQERGEAENERMMTKAEYDKLTENIIGAAIEVHRELGPGLLESVYEACLIKELQHRGLKYQSQVRLPVIYKNEEIGKDFFIDVLVEDAVVVELKAIEIVLPVHEVQLVTYLKLARKRLGLLINFNVPVLRDGLHRKVNKLME